MIPYKDEKIKSNQFVRIFVENVKDDELIWHRDKKDRTIKVLEGSDWKLQYDNELPFVMMMNETYEIKAEQYHRIIKGKQNLILQIEEK